MRFKNVTIIGLGLIGGSLGWALKRAENVEKVFGVDIDKKTIDYAIEKGIIDSGSSELDEGVKHSEVIVIATYVGIIPKIVKSIAALVPGGTIVTDVGSVKGKIVREIESFLPSRLHFIGGHPIAGTERSGVLSADYSLFQGKRCILTPTARTNPEALTRVKTLWESIGSRVFTMDVETHDRVLGFVSHLPHVVAYALLNSVASQNEPENLLDFAGGGLRDYTRIGASSPEMWSDIFLSNKENMLKAIREFKKAIEKIEWLIEEEDLKGVGEELKKAIKERNDIDSKSKIS